MFLSASKAAKCEQSVLTGQLREGIGRSTATQLPNGLIRRPPSANLASDSTVRYFVSVSERKER